MLTCKIQKDKAKENEEKKRVYLTTKIIKKKVIS